MLWHPGVASTDKAVKQQLTKVPAIGVEGILVQLCRPAMQLLDRDGEVGCTVFRGHCAPQRLDLVDALLQRQSCDC